MDKSKVIATWDETVTCLNGRLKVEYVETHEVRDVPESKGVEVGVTFFEQDPHDPSQIIFSSKYIGLPGSGSQAVSVEEPNEQRVIYKKL